MFDLQKFKTWEQERDWLSKIFSKNFKYSSTEVRTFFHSFFCKLYRKSLFFAVCFPDSVLIDIIIRMSQIEKRVISGANEQVQLNSLISTFQTAREMQMPEWRKRNGKVCTYLFVNFQKFSTVIPWRDL